MPYIQMHEFEALLFSSPAAIASVLQQEDVKNWAEDVLSEFSGNPESVNDSPQTAPSKRLGKKAYRKIVHGERIAKEIGLNALRAQCTGFGDWITRLEALRS